MLRVYCKDTAITAYNHLWILLFVLISSAWYHHHEYVFGRAYKMFGIILCIFSQSNSVTIAMSKSNYIVYVSDHMQLTYCSISYWLQLHILLQVQQRATMQIAIF